MIIKPGTTIFNSDKEEFEVLEEIGVGGCGVVYKIHNKSTKNNFAVKTLSPSFTDDKLIKGLINEAQMAIQISHINVLKYYFFHDGSQFPELPPYIIMEFANGGSLATLIKNAKEKIAESELLNMYSYLISGMKAINEKIIHRDIKPENILFKDDVLKIADFGLSKIIDEKTRTSSFKGWGTPKYIAPEAWVGKKNTIQMDIYSMGIMFYELLTLSYPFEPTNPYDYSEWQNVHLYSSPKQIGKLRSDTSPKLAQIILKMIEKEVSVRYKNWEEIESDLESLEISTETDGTIARIVKKKMEKDEGQLKEKLEAEKKQKKREQFEKMIQFKIQKGIIEPLQVIIDKFNENYVHGKMRIEKKGYFHLFEYLVHLVSGTMLILKIAPLRDEDCVKELIIDDYGRRRTRREMKRPVLNKKNILAWGMLESQYGTGFNIVLLENKEDMYGDWYVLINTNSALATNHRRNVEPFVFKFEELDEEIECIGAMHVYNTKVEKLSMDHFVEYIEKYN